MLFAAFVLEKEPMYWFQVPGAILTWLQNAGFLSTFALTLIFLSENLQRGSGRSGLSTIKPIRNVLASSIGGFLLLVLFGLYAVSGFAWAFLNAANLANWLLVAAGALAIVLLLVPPVHALLFAVRWGRVWAMARLSQKEAIRNRIFLVFMVMGFVFLFAGWFVGGKPSDQVRNYVRVLYWSMTPLFLLIAALLGAFSIPTDIKNLSIHTIVTKPIEKFEVVLGRFLGYAMILSASLIVVTSLSLVYLARGVTEEARRESLLARVPIFGDFGSFRSKGESVGREWEYRKYFGALTPDGTRPIYASWRFWDIPAFSAGAGNPVFEFTFDIFRLTKGEQNRGVFCVFTFSDAYEDDIEVFEAKLEKYREEKTQGKSSEDDLIAKYGIFQSNEEVSDYVTQRIEIPRAFIESVAKKGSKIQLLVNINRFNSGSRQQMLGVARRDIYLLAEERSFYANFFKGVIGLWMSFILTLAVAIACSTRLSGVISFLCALFYYFAGLMSDYIVRLATNNEAGGGPMEAAFRLFTKSPVGMQLDETPTTSLFKGFDTVYLWILRRFANLVPDMNRFDLHNYVANGFDISWTQVLLTDNLIPLLGYLIPWLVVSYYMMNSREIANPT